MTPNQPLTPTLAVIKANIDDQAFCLFIDVLYKRGQPNEFATSAIADEISALLTVCTPFNKEGCLETCYQGRLAPCAPQQQRWQCVEQCQLQQQQFPGTSQTSLLFHTSPAYVLLTSVEQKLTTQSQYAAIPVWSQRCNKHAGSLHPQHECNSTSRGHCSSGPARGFAGPSAASLRDQTQEILLVMPLLRC